MKDEFENYGLISVFELAASKDAPEWLLLVRAGDYYDVGNERPIMITRAHLASMRERKADMPADLVIDYHHQTLATAEGQVAVAAGFIDRTEIRADGDELWGHVREWTAAAAERIRNRELRYLSPVIEWNQPHWRTGAEATALHSVALTNRPNFQDLLPLVAEARRRRPHPHLEDPMKKLRELLTKRGVTVAESATDDDVLKLAETHLAALDAKVTAAEAKATDAGAKLTAAEAKIGASGGAAVPADLAKALDLAPTCTVAEAVNAAAKLATRPADNADLARTVAELKGAKLDAEVDAWIAEGRCTPVEKDHVRKLLDVAPDTTRAQMAVRPATGVTASSLGKASGAEPELTAAEMKLVEQGYATKEKLLETKKRLAQADK